MSLGYYTPLYDLPPPRRSAGFTGGLLRGLLPWGGMPRDEGLFTLGTAGYLGGTMAGGAALSALAARALMMAPHPVAKGAGALLTAIMSRPMLRTGLLGAYYGARAIEDASPQERAGYAALGGGLGVGGSAGFQALKRWRGGPQKAVAAAPRPPAPPTGGAVQTQLFPETEVAPGRLFADIPPPAWTVPGSGVSRPLFGEVAEEVAPRAFPARGAQMRLPLEEQMGLPLGGAGGRMVGTRGGPSIFVPEPGVPEGVRVGYPPAPPTATFEGLFPNVIPMPTPVPLPRLRLPGPARAPRGVPFVRGQMDLFTPTGKVSKWAAPETRETALALLNSGFVPSPVVPAGVGRVLSKIFETPTGVQLVGVIARTYQDQLGAGTAAAATRSYLEQMVAALGPTTTPGQIRRMVSNAVLGFRNLVNPTPTEAAAVIESAFGFVAPTRVRLDERLMALALHKTGTKVRTGAVSAIESPMLEPGTGGKFREVVRSVLKGAPETPFVEGPLRKVRGRMGLEARGALVEPAAEQFFARGLQGVTIRDLARSWGSAGADRTGMIVALTKAGDIRNTFLRRIAKNILPEGTAELGEQAVEGSGRRFDVMMGDLLDGFMARVREETGEGAVAGRLGNLPARAHFYPAFSAYIAGTAPNEPFAKIAGPGAVRILAEALAVPASVLERRTLPPGAIQGALTVISRAMADGATPTVARKLAVQQLGVPTISHLLIDNAAEIGAEAVWAASVKTGKSGPVLARLIGKHTGLGWEEVFGFAEEMSGQMLREPEDVLIVMGARLGLPLEGIVNKIGQEGLKDTNKALMAGTKNLAIRKQVDEIFGRAARLGDDVRFISEEDLLQITPENALFMEGTSVVAPSATERGVRTFLDAFPAESEVGIVGAAAPVLERLRGIVRPNLYRAFVGVVGDADTPFTQRALAAGQEVLDSNLPKALQAKGIARVVRDSGLLERYMQVANVLDEMGSEVGEVVGKRGKVRPQSLALGATRTAGVLHDLLSHDLQKINRDYRSGDFVHTLLSKVEGVLGDPKLAPGQQLVAINRIVRETVPAAPSRYAASVGGLQVEKIPAREAPRGSPLGIKEVLRVRSAEKPMVITGRERPTRAVRMEPDVPPEVYEPPTSPWEVMARESRPTRGFRKAVYVGSEMPSEESVKAFPPYTPRKPMTPKVAAPRPEPLRGGRVRPEDMLREPQFETPRVVAQRFADQIKQDHPGVSAAALSRVTRYAREALEKGIDEDKVLNQMRKSLGVGRKT